MMEKIERAIKLLLFGLLMLLIVDMFPAIVQDKERLLNQKAPARTETMQKEESMILEELPEVYDGREHGICPVIKEQGNVGNCWAVAATTALEARLLPKKHFQFSETHMSEENAFTRYADGGDYTMIMAYLAGWQGPVLQEEEEEKPEAVRHVQEMHVLKNCSIEDIKREVYQYGAVQASIYMDLKNAFASSAFYNQIDHSYYYKGEEEANHDVCILGWDDHFPAEAFHVNTKQNGAFICQNSWGEEFGEQGIFYVSYEDSLVRKNVISYAVVEKTNNYDQLYQTDICGWVGVVGYGDSVAYASNTFKVGAGETVEAVGFYATGADTDYEVYLLEKGHELDHVMVQKPAAEGHLKYAGFYTIPLTESRTTSVDEEEVTVVIRLNTPGESYPIATEYNADENTEDVTIDDGDGYISHNGIIWQGTESSFHCNVCMKLYTRKE